MAEELVSIKGSGRGLKVVFSPQAGVEELTEALREKLAASGDFFQGAQVHLELGTRTFTWEELARIVQELIAAGLVVTLGSNGAESGESRGGGEETPAARRRKGQEYGTLMAKRTLRSGQKVNFDGNVVLWGDVNPGAEIVASGDIIILGACRGVAHAGAQGDNQAIVLALRLQPTQLRIGEHIARPPDDEAVRTGVPEVARVREDKVIIEAYNVWSR